MSKLRDRRHRRDQFHAKAKRQGFAARAVFKLETVDQKHSLFHPGARVLDLGCRPGSWLQYVHRETKGNCSLVGIDRTDLDITIPDAIIHVGSVFDVSPEELLGDLSHFDVVMSDMAPDTSGIRNVDQSRSENLFERALDIAEATLAPGGNFVGKLFLGPAFEDLRNRCRGLFGKVAMVKPKSSRAQSIEQYMVGKDFHG